MEPYDLLKYMVNAFESLGIRYFITGSIASIFYGEPRFTNDIDVVADIGEEHISGILKLFRDITSMLKISGDKIDMAYIEYWAKKLDLLDIWNAILQRLKKT